MIPRVQKDVLVNRLKSNKLLVLSGPKGVGKMRLLNTVIGTLEWTSEQFDCSNSGVRKKIENTSILAASDQNVLILQEAQYLESLEQIVESVLGGMIRPTTVLCCSYTPKLDELLMEALRMEGLEILLFAPSFYESAKHFGLPQEERLLEERLIYGNYPSVLENLAQATSTLNELIQSVLFTQLSANDRINKGDKMMRVLQLLAFHIGDAVSYNEIAERCDLDNETVERYVELLENAYILIRLPSFHTEKRYELKKSHAIYFADNGIRNALINNFNPTLLRNDMDQLWRNYLISERVKWIRMNQLNKKVHFWKTHTKQRMDFIETDGVRIEAYKTDWQKRKKVKMPKSFIQHYPTAKMGILDKSTYWAFLTRKQ